MNKTNQAATAATAVLFILALGLGCAGPKHVSPESAVVCPKCEMVWIEYPDPDDPYRVETIPVQDMRCPDCESAALHFFSTGETDHVCKTCGTGLIHCTSHDN